ncbi:MAG: VOC family protein [Anaerolineae bacterium]
MIAPHLLHGTFDRSAQRFYQHVFGWEYLDLGEQFGHYHYALANGRPAAGIGQQQPGAPTSRLWTIFLASAAGDAERVTAFGGQIVVEPMTVGDAGKMTVCADPSGALFGLWQPIHFIVDNTDAALERVLAAGGSIGVPAFDTPYGRMAVIGDPYGAAVSIVQLPMQ